MWRTSSASCKDVQGVSVPVHESHTNCFSTHVWNGNICICTGLCIYAFEVQLVWQCQRFFKTTTTGLHCIALFLRPLGKHPRVYSVSEAKPYLDTKLFYAGLQTNSSDSHSTNNSCNTALKNTLEVDKDMQKQRQRKKKSKHPESPAMLAEWKQSPNWGKHIGHSWKAKLSKLSKCIMVLTSETTRTRASVCIIKLFATAPRLPVPLNSSSNLIKKKKFITISIWNT